jgi:hypothetical protein
MIITLSSPNLAPKLAITALTNPGPSVLYPRLLPFSKRTVFTAPNLSAFGSIESINGMMAVLCGIVRFTPANPCRDNSLNPSSSSEGRR